MKCPMAREDGLSLCRGWEADISSQVISGDRIDFRWRIGEQSDARVAAQIEKAAESIAVDRNGAAPHLYPRHAVGAREASQKVECAVTRWWWCSPCQIPVFARPERDRGRCGEARYGALARSFGHSYARATIIVPALFLLVWPLGPGVVTSEAKELRPNVNVLRRQCRSVSFGRTLLAARGEEERQEESATLVHHLYFCRSGRVTAMGRNRPISPAAAARLRS